MDFLDALHEARAGRPRAGGLIGVSGFVEFGFTTHLPVPTHLPPHHRRHPHHPGLALLLPRATDMTPGRDDGQEVVLYSQGKKKKKTLTHKRPPPEVL